MHSAADIDIAKTLITKSFFLTNIGKRPLIMRFDEDLKGLCCSREDIGITKTLIIKVVFSYTHR